MTAPSAPPPRPPVPCPGGTGTDRRVRPLAVTAACLRRDAAEAWSYRLPFLWRFVELFTGLVMLYFLSRLVGNRIATVSGSPITGGYFGYAVLGTTLVAVLHSALTSFASRLRTDQTTGTLEAMLATPTPAWLTVVAGSAYGMVQIVVMELVTLLVAVGIFGLRFDATPAGVAVLVPGLVATLACFFSFGLLLAAFTMVFKRGQGLATLAVSGFTLLGGVYYPVSLLPTFLRDVGAALPFTWAIDLLRGSLVFGAAPVSRLVELAASDAVLLPLGIWLFGRAVDRTRRTGTLAQY
ncbi:MAG: ABC transporter permease [Actinomycetota bacterium]|nr:ABC transporter permease [Actinomycetota bacterium]